MRGARRRNRARRRLKSLRFILFNVGAALSFVPRINSNQRNPRLSPPAKAWNAVENPLQTSPLSVSNWPLFIAPRINNFPSACVPLPPPLCSPLFPPFCVKNEVTKERKERGRWIFRGKEGLFLFFFPFEKKFVPITFIQMKNEVNCKTCAR